MPLPLLPGGPGPSAPGGRATTNMYSALGRVPIALATEGFDSMVHWTQAQLLEWANDSIRDLARGSGVNVEYDGAAMTLATATADYAYPARHLSTIDVSVEGEKLRPASSHELSALEQDWTTVTGPAVLRWTEGEGTAELRAYPIPTSGANGQAVSLVFHRYLADFTIESPFVTMPSVLQDYLFHRVHARARRAESIGAMPDAAAFSESVAGLIAQVAGEYWGGCQ